MAESDLTIDNSILTSESIIVKDEQESDINVIYDDEDEEEVLPTQFTVKCHPEEPEEPNMVTFKSVQKSMLFGRASGHLGKMLRE